MLPVSLDDKAPYVIMCDDRQGFHILLIEKDMLSQPQPFVPLWVFACGDRPSMEIATSWFEVRRALWQGWGKLAQAIGPELFLLHMSKVMAEEPIGVFQATMVQADADPCLLNLGQMVCGDFGYRNERLYQHRFASDTLRNGFFDWFRQNADNGSPEELLRIGIRQGTARLGKLLDELAAAPKPHRKGRRGQRSERVRQAA